jgi:hypothetical protein
MQPTYRIYSVSERDVITGAFDRKFSDDQDALDQAMRYLAVHPIVEIWQIDRLVGRLEREPPSDQQRAIPSRSEPQSA